jgi:hypothetical protein
MIKCGERFRWANSVRRSISARWFLLVMVLAVAGTPGSSAQTANVTPTKTVGGYRIAGTVVSKIDGHSLTQARVSLRDISDRLKLQSVVTAEGGKFEFNGLPAGKYSLAADKRGFISARYDEHEQYFSTAIVTGPDFDTGSMVLRLSPAAVIAGKVLDEVGEPVRNASVALYFDDHTGDVDQIHRIRESRTDDQGQYEITPLTPGTYFVSANAKPWYAVHPTSDAGRPNRDAAERTFDDRSLDVAYPVTYYADVNDADSATPIPVRGGERLEVDIHLNPAPALHLLFRVQGDGSNGFNIPQLQQPAFDGSAGVQGTGGNMVSPGIVELTGIPAGRYNVVMGGRGQGIQMNGVDVSKDGEEIDTSRGEALGSVKVSVRVQGENGIPARLAIGLRSGHREVTAHEDVDAKGEAELKQVPAGKYEVLVWGAARPYTVARMSAEGGAASGHTLTVGVGATASVSLTLVGGSGEVQGTVKRAGLPLPGAMVALVPKIPEGNHDLFRRDQTNLDGSFSLRGVVPGSYTVVAIDQGWDLDWTQPGVIAAYLKLGRAIEVSSGRPLILSEAIEAQPK